MCVVFGFVCLFVLGGGEGCIKIALKQPFVICTGLLNHCPFFFFFFFFYSSVLCNSILNKLFIKYGP